LTLIIYASYFGSGVPNEIFVYEGCLPLDYVIEAMSTMDGVYSWRVIW